MLIRTALLASTSLLLLPAAAVAQDVPAPPWAGQPAPSPTATVPTAIAPQSAAPAVQAPETAADQPDPSEDGSDIVVTGQKPRGSVVGDIPPENTLSSRDIRGTGATSITELLAAIAPQTGSARGRGGEAPVLLLNGQRISGFQEIRDLPPEAIERLEILPEEVALKYGYAADQRVVNIVLRRRFRSTAARADAGVATDGGYATGLAEVSRLQVGANGRTQATLHAEANSALGENEREITAQPLTSSTGTVDPRAYRTLVGSQRSIRGTVVANRTILGDVSGTGNLDLSHTEGSSLFGVPSAVTTGDPYPSFGALGRSRVTDAAHAGMTLNGQKARWHWSLLGNGDVARTVTNSDRGIDVSGTTPVEFPRDRSRSTRTAAGIDGTINGPLATLPAGRANVTLKADVDTLHLDSVASRAGLTSSAKLSRDHGGGSVNIDLPIAKRNGALGAIGSLTLNANAAVDHYSDFGTSTTLGAGANWSPAPRLNIITSYTREEGIPSINNLGDPILTTPGTRVFDYTQGHTVLVTATTGGNPALLADRRKVWKVGANWQPSEKTDFRVRADFVSSRLTNPVETFPGPSPVLEAAFPDRFT
ncbi:MAG: TonB-dependent receptor plug domain-containing protein, partial [Pseudomonadota bacterium]|nr:TonB-dependent receptor plug domain-containing protein [Pseudomonadota bacterium]